MSYHNKPNQVRRVIAIVVVALLCVVQVRVAPTAHAAALSGGRDHLNRNNASLTTGVTHIVTFTTSSTNGTEAKVKLTFPDADDGLWCRVAGADLVVTTNTEDSATGLPGTLVGTCAAGSGSSSYDTITITGVTDLSVSTRYGVKVADGSTAKLGTPTAANDKVVTIATLTGADAAIDSQNIALSIISNDQIAVTATVDPTLTFALSGNTAALGTLAAATINKVGITSTVSTNAQNGFASYVYYNNTLRIDVSNDIDNTAGGTIVAGTEEFGVATSEATAVDIATWSPAACTTNASTSNATALTTSGQSYSTATAPVSSDAVTLCFLASITATTTAGAYSNTVTLVTAAKF